MSQGSSTSQRPDQELSLVCSEVWGGNQHVHTPVALPGLQGVLYSRPCDGALGGDVHYLSVCGSGLLSRFCLADVVGHGETVAEISTKIHRLMRRHMNTTDQRRLLRRLNDDLAVVGESAMTTMAAVSYFPPQRKLSLSYAGHPPGWIYRAETGIWTRLGLHPEESTGVHDAALAIAESNSFTRRTERVKRGDRLLLVTDGIAETPGTDGGRFGEDRIISVLDDHRDAPVEDQVSALLETLDTYRGDHTPRHDDMSLLLVEFV
ncbi:MAG: PP2C family protein-serine/threonine phosphatase, partial [Planctomycetota bacterium]